MISRKFLAKAFSFGCLLTFYFINSATVKHKSIIVLRIRQVLWTKKLLFQTLEVL